MVGGFWSTSREQRYVRAHMRADWITEITMEVILQVVATTEPQQHILYSIVLDPQASHLGYCHVGP
eukprot:SAG31_NODE_21201_length_555_cov_1.089912_2_plen_66_part_00